MHDEKKYFPISFSKSIGYEYDSGRHVYAILMIHKVKNFVGQMMPLFSMDKIVNYVNSHDTIFPRTSLASLLLNEQNVTPEIFPSKDICFTLTQHERLLITYLENLNPKKVKLDRLLNLMKSMGLEHLCSGTC